MFHRPELSPDLTQRFRDAGVAVVEYALLPEDLTRMDAGFPMLAVGGAGARTADFDRDFVNWLADHDGLLALAERLALTPMRFARALALDKSPGANWFVPWHQDRAVDGVDRAVSMLERMIALRIHLDDCDEANGPLEVIAGSHTHGRLTAGDIAVLTGQCDPLLCLAVRGDIVALRPLLVHRSQRARVPAARRVLHLEFVAQAVLPS
jgi:ectoine hydroxylase-related dioxygenase (phytanoyl-CoA dioxygenase family)